MNTQIELGNRVINHKSKPYIIAEIGVNHGGSMEQAKKLIELAKKGGADAAKFQSYKADTLASKNSPSYWDTNKEPTRSQHELFKKYDNFNAEDYIELAEYSKKIGIDFLSTPFDDASIEFLYPIVPFFKIASADLTNLPFLRKIASKGKPVVLSTGASTLGEIDIALETLEKAGCKNIALLHCILNYPTPNPQANLKMITGLKRAYPNYLIGYSDHTLPDESMIPLLTAHLLGAVILEKHFTHDKTLVGNDHYHAMDVIDLTRFIEISNRTHILLGESDHKQPISTESISRQNARRSIVVNNDLKVGHIITTDDITYKRPGIGISPLYWDEVIGMKLTQNVVADDILKWSHLEPNQ
jgi:N-acetylneuraminate synthase